MRKGQYVLGHKWIYFIVALFLIALMFLFLRTMLVNYQVGKIACSDRLTDELIIAKTLYAPVCFVHEDQDTGAQPGTIDAEKFTQSQLTQCFKYIDKKVNISIGANSIGAEIDKPKIINKPILLYKDNHLTPAVMTFRFEEERC